MEQLIRLDQVSLKDNRFAKRIARMYLDSDAKKAEQFAMEAVYINPYDPDAHEVLQKVAEKAGDKAAIEREQRVIPVLGEWVRKAKEKAKAEQP